MNVPRGMFLPCVLTLAACASQAEKTAQVAPARVANPVPIVTDAAYVAAVERKARRRGIDVQWVHAPVRRVDAD